VLATNVAETSLTVPGIRYVVDPGTARIIRYSQRTKVQRLPIEGQPGVGHPARRPLRSRRARHLHPAVRGGGPARPPEFTDPEILRTNLASVILQMTAAGLGEIEDFPVRRAAGPARGQGRHRPAARAGGARPVRARPAQAAHADRDARSRSCRSTPRLGRMVIEADRNGVLHEVLVIVAGPVDPGPSRAAGRQAAAGRRAARALRDETSDFLGYLALWEHVRELRRELSANQFRRG
jgi:ATP-dependent helicase HrpA